MGRQKVMLVMSVSRATKVSPMADPRFSYSANPASVVSTPTLSLVQVLARPAEAVSSRDTATTLGIIHLRDTTECLHARARTNEGTASILPRRTQLAPGQVGRTATHVRARAPTQTPRA